MKRRRGIMLISLLAIVVFVTMLAGALLGLNKQWFVQVGWQRDRTQALEMARGGLNHLLHRLTYVSHFSGDVQVNLPQGSYFSTFNSASAYHSVNNLMNSAASPDLNFRGNVVGPQSADVVVTGTAGHSQVRCHALLRRGLSFHRSAGSVGQILISGDASVDGIDSATLPSPSHIEGGLYSHFASTLAAQAISWDNLGGASTFSLGPSSRLLTAPPAEAGAQGFSSTLTAALPSSSLNQQATGQVPSYNVGKLVNTGSASPNPGGLLPSGSGHALASPGIFDQRYVDGDLTINGDVTLNDGTLLVHGKLTINGGIKGKGAIYVDGDVHVLGGNSSVLSNQPTGAALFSSGDVRLQGLDARGYLNSLSATYPTVHDNLAAFNTTLSAMSSDANALNAGGVTWLTNQLTRQYWGMTPPAGRSTAGYWVNSIRSPNGNFADGASDADVPGLINAIRASLGPAYAGDVSAQRVVKALEEVHYEFRRNLDGCNGNVTLVDNQIPTVPNFAAYAATSRLHYPAFDDSTLPLASRTLDSQQSDPGYDPVKACQGVQAWFRNNPLDLSWIGKSYFQGVVYAQGNLVVDTQFNVLGALVSQGNVTLSNGANLVFVQDYMKLGGAFGPVSVLFYEEL